MMILLIAFALVAGATSALAQGYQSPYNPSPPQHYNNAPGLDTPGLTNIPGVRDQPPSYSSHTNPYVPYPTVSPYSPPATYNPYRPSGSPYGRGDDN
jgi:hypothetical protein